MVKMSRDMKRRVSTVVWIAKTAFHLGFIPTMLYLGAVILFLVQVPVMLAYTISRVRSYLVICQSDNPFGLSLIYFIKSPTAPNVPCSLNIEIIIIIIMPFV